MLFILSIVRQKLIFGQVRVCSKIMKSRQHFFSGKNVLCVQSNLGNCKFSLTY